MSCFRVGDIDVGEGGEFSMQGCLTGEHSNVASVDGDCKNTQNVKHGTDTGSQDNINSNKHKVIIIEKYATNSTAMPIGQCIEIIRSIISAQIVVYRFATNDFATNEKDYEIVKIDSIGPTKDNCKRFLCELSSYDCALKVAAMDDITIGSKIFGVWYFGTIKPKAKTAKQLTFHFDKPDDSDERKESKTRKNNTKGKNGKNEKLEKEDKQENADESRSPSPVAQYSWESISGPFAMRISREGKSFLPIGGNFNSFKNIGGGMCGSESTGSVVSTSYKSNDSNTMNTCASEDQSYYGNYNYSASAGPLSALTDDEEEENGDNTMNGACEKY